MKQIVLWREWQNLMDGFGVAEAASESVFSLLVSQYREPHRHYHNLRHVAEVVATTGMLADQAAAPVAVQLAAFYHDAIYDPRRSDNEIRSASLAVEQLAILGIEEEMAAEAARLIRLTAGHAVDAEDANGAVLLDADLAILGAKPDRYREYARAIRREYAWMAEARYRQERAAVLAGFLARERIYCTARMYRQLEGQARWNLQGEVTALQAR